VAPVASVGFARFVTENFVAIEIEIRNVIVLGGHAAATAGRPRSSTPAAPCV
jgi:hypothetical protein